MAQRTCSIEGCEKTYLANGFCSLHYQRAKSGTSMTAPPHHAIRVMGSVLERFWAYVDKNGPIPAHAPHLGPCMLWTGAPEKDGYGRLGVDGKTLKAHRLAYELFVGPIPDGLAPDHLCRTPSCVKAVADDHGPAHLELVTPRENTLRGVGPSATNARKTHCWQGHEFTPENTYTTPTGGRSCRECQRAACKRYRTR
jgi:hypothetical protein